MLVAAGGIADGRGLAAALTLGAEGVLVGTRFYATGESLGHENARARILASSGEDTVRTSIFDTVRGYEWPGGITGRALRNDFAERWNGREREMTRLVKEDVTRQQQRPVTLIARWFSPAKELRLSRMCHKQVRS